MKKRTTERPKNKTLKIRKTDTVFVGLDVHKLSIHAAIRLNGVEIAKKVLRARSGDVLKLLRPFTSSQLQVVYEAGPTGFGLARALIAEGIDVAVISPAKIPREAVAGAKSDRLDCCKLALFSEKGMLKAVAIPTVDEEALREIMRRRNSLVEKRRRVKQQIKSFLLFHDIAEPVGLTTWKSSSLQALERLPMHPDLRFSLDRLLEELWHLVDETRLVEKRLRLMAVKENLHETIRRLKTHPGVGEVTAMQMATEIFKPERFQNSKQVAAFVGLAPRIRQSGQSRTEGHLLKAGCGHLRSSLIEASWAWMRRDKSARKLYNHLVRNTGSGKKAIVALARRMAINLWIMLTRHQDYRPLTTRA